MHCSLDSFKTNIDLDVDLTTNDYIPAHPFESAQDVVDRLLPFHLWQVHDKDLDIQEKSETRLKEEESTQMKLVERKASLMKRLRRVRVESDDVSPLHIISQG